MRNSAAVSSARPGRAVSQADVKTPAHLRRSATVREGCCPELGFLPGRVRLKCREYKRSAHIHVCMCHCMLKGGHPQSLFGLTAARALPGGPWVIAMVGKPFN